MCNRLSFNVSIDVYALEMCLQINIVVRLSWGLR